MRTAMPRRVSVGEKVIVSELSNFIGVNQVLNLTINQRGAGIYSLATTDMILI